jgi:hypothetical protein
MSGLAGAVTRTLAATNGGPGLTARELSECLGSPEPVIRNVLAGLVFRDKCVVCNADGVFKLGDPAALLDRSKFPHRG